MRFYEVFLRLDRAGKEIGRTCIQLMAPSPFKAALEAEKQIDGRYGAETVCHACRVNEITQDEFIYTMAA